MMRESRAPDLREFLVRLEAAGDLIRVEEEIDLAYELGALCRALSDADGPAALVRRFKGRHARAKTLAVNLYGPRRRIASALGVAENRLLSFVAERIEKRVAPQLLPGGAAPSQE